VASREVRMSNCRGCGTVLDPTDQEVNQGVNEILEASLQDAITHGEICPLCGHSKAEPVSHRKTVQFALLLALLILAGGLAIAYRMNRNTERQGGVEQALKQIESDPQVSTLLGAPITIQGQVAGQVKHDETGWRELQLTFSVHGSKTSGIVRVSGGRENGPWKFTTLEVLLPQLQKKADLITGKIVVYSPDAYQEVHTEAFIESETVLSSAPAPSWDGDFPCVYAVAGDQNAPQLGTCATPMPMSPASRQIVDRFETDLRRGAFVLRQSDLAVNEAGFDLPLTRTYAAQDWLPQNRNHAFGRNTNHPYDIAPLGTRNPYTEQTIVLENGDFIYFPRVSKGTGYSDAIYRHSETGGAFYRATQQWNGNGWITKLQDGSTILFPESYNARNLAQGAPIEMTDAAGNKIELQRDGKRNLQEIHGPNPGFIKFAYDGENRIVRADDDRGNWTTYAYNTKGFLTDVTHSDGTARYYFYENELLTWVRDEKARPLLHNYYDSAWLEMQDFGNGNIVRYRYELSRNGKYAETVFVTMPDGSVKTIKPSGSVSYIYKRMPGI
jgi:YD repeat-containing protein